MSIKTDRAQKGKGKNRVRVEKGLFERRKAETQKSGHEDRRGSSPGKRR